MAARTEDLPRPGAFSTLRAPRRIAAAPEARRSTPRGVAQPGRALRSGRRSRRFKSCHPDQFQLLSRIEPAARTPEALNTLLSSGHLQWSHGFRIRIRNGPTTKLRRLSAAA